MARQRKTGDAQRLAPEEQGSTWDGSAAGVAAAQDLLPQGQLVPATTPGGMVRISKGDQQRCIWPVHLSGWQQLGWTVLGAQGAELQVAEPRTAGRRNTKPEPLVEPLGAIDSFDPLEPLNPPLDPDQNLNSLAWDDTTTEQP